MDNDSPVDKLIDEQLASDINEILETVEAGVGSFASHTEDLNNPHQVTKEQVGLGNADNTSDMDKPISNAVASAINTLQAGMGLAVQGIMSAIHTHIQENEKQHQKIKSSVETLKQEAFSAIKTLETDFDSDLETAKEEILNTVDGFKVNLDFIATSVETLKAQTQTNQATTESAINTLNQNLNGVKSAVQTLDQTNQQEHQDTLTLLDEKIAEVKGLITALDNKIISAASSLKALFAEADIAVKNEVTTAYQAKDTELQSAIDNKAANDHNHDSVYAKIGTAALSDGSVKSNHIAENAITANHLAPNSVGASELGYTPAKRTHCMTKEELFTRAGVSGKITTAALVTGIVQNIENFRGITVAGWVQTMHVSDLPADSLLITITVINGYGIYMEARAPFGDNSLWIGSTNNGTWGGWKQVRTSSGNTDVLAYHQVETQGGLPSCANSGFRVLNNGSEYCLVFGDGEKNLTQIVIAKSKNVTL